MSTTLDPSNKATNITLSNGNLTWRKSVSNADNSVRVVHSCQKGKFYAEAGIETSGDVVFGIVKSTFNLNSLFPGGADSNLSIGYQSGGTVKVNNSASVTGMDVATTNGNRIAIAWDMGAQLFWAKVIGGATGNWNGSGTANPATGTGGVSFSALGSAGTFPVWLTVSSFVNGDGGTIYPNKAVWTGTPPAGFGEVNEEATINRAEVWDDWSAPDAYDYDTDILGVPLANLTLNAYVLAVTKAAMALTQVATGVLYKRLLSVTKATMALTPVAVGLLHAYFLVVTKATMALTQVTTGTLYKRLLTVAQGAIALTANAVGAIKASPGAYLLAVTKATMALTAVAVAPLYKRLLAVTKATMALTAVTINGLYNRLLGVTKATMALTGISVALSRGRVLAVLSGALALTPKTIGTLRGYAISVTKASLVLTQQFVNLLRIGGAIAAKGAALLIGL